MPQGPGLTCALLRLPSGFCGTINQPISYIIGSINHVHDATLHLVLANVQARQTIESSSVHQAVHHHANVQALLCALLCTHCIVGVPH